MSNRDFKTASFDENSRYTVADGTPDRPLIAPIVVAA
jgi:hypothetical protein